MRYDCNVRVLLGPVAVVGLAVLVTSAAGRTSASLCRGAALAGRFGVVPGSAGAGNIIYALRLRNVGTSSCTVTGLPAGRLLAVDRAALPTRVRPAQRGALTAVLVTLAPGQSTFATARFSPDVPGPGEGNVGQCERTAYWLRVA